MPSAFISHSSPDDRIVQEMVQYLRALGYEQVFNDSHTIEPDEVFWSRIEKGIRACDAFVVMLSHASVASYWVDREVHLARDLGKKVIPIRIDDCKLPPSFDGRDVIDLRHGRGDKVKLAPSRILRHSPPILFGREKWLDALDAAWAKPTLNVYTLVAWGGVGKTSLVAHWVSQRLAAKGWPGVERYFDWSFYSQGTGESRQSSSDLFIQKALEFFDDPDPIKGSPWERGERLARLIRQHRTLLVLDGIEPLQYPLNDPQAGRLKDQALEALLQGLAADNPGLCIVTTREHLKNIENQATTEEQKLDKLVKEAAIALFRHLRIVGTDEEMEAAWKDAGGHALTLQLLGRFIVDAYEDKDIRHFREVKFEEADKEHQGRSAFKVMIAYEKWLQSAGPERQRELAVLRLTGLFDRPMTRDCLQALRAEPVIPGLTDALVNLKETEWNIALKRLSDVELLTATQQLVDAHPLIREYFATQLKDSQPAAFQSAHSRLFDHLCANTEYQPDTLDGLQPLYQAVVHGCLAGMQRKVLQNLLVPRIFRYEAYYTSYVLGAFGTDLAALYSFLDAARQHPLAVLDDLAQAFVMKEMGYCLRSLGRLEEAAIWLRRALNAYERNSRPKDAVVVLLLLLQVYEYLGELDKARELAEKGVAFVDRENDQFNRGYARVLLGAMFHHEGRIVDANKWFTESTPLLSEGDERNTIVRVFALSRYWDFLLTQGHFEQVLVNCEENQCLLDELRKLQAAVSEGWYHLAWGRATFSKTLANKSTIPADAFYIVDQSLTKFRQAGRQDAIPHSLLLRAAFLCAEADAHRRFGEEAKAMDCEMRAQSDLDEAWEIAKRGPMRLHMADIHLHRARFFCATSTYPWPGGAKDDLRAARTLIEKCGYWRRKEELERAEAAVMNWARVKERT